MKIVCFSFGDYCWISYVDISFSIFWPRESFQWFFLICFLVDDLFTEFLMEGNHLYILYIMYILVAKLKGFASTWNFQVSFLSDCLWRRAPTLWVIAFVNNVYISHFCFPSIILFSNNHFKLGDKHKFCRGVCGTEES